MELDVDQLAAEGVTLAFERPFGRHRIVIGPSGGVSGQIASDAGGTYVEARTPDVLALREVTWALEAGEVRARAELDLQQVAVELSIPREAPTHGRIAVKRAETQAVALAHASLGDGEITAEGATLHEVAIALDEDATTVTVEEARFEALTVPLGDGQVTFEGLCLRGLEVSVPKGGGFRVRLRAIESRGVTLPMGETELTIDALAVAEGATFGPEGVAAAAVAAGAVRLSMAGLGARPSAEPDAAPAAKPATEPRDLSFLDQLAGRIHLDLVTDIRLPVIRTRRATHKVRLEVRDGMIEYKRLEKGLAPLEDTVLDFALRKGRLVLEKDIPLIPFDRRTLVSWALDDEEKRLADRGWVRLARLARPHLEIDTTPKKEPRRRKEPKGESMVRELRAEAIDVALRLDAEPRRRSTEESARPAVALPGGARLRFGHVENGTAIERLRVQGRVVYRPDGDHEIHAVEANGDRIALGLDALPLGARRAAVGALAIDRLATLRVHLDGLRPTAIEGHLEGVALREVVVTPPDDSR